MRLTILFKRFWALDFDQKRMIAEAYFYLGWARTLVALPFRKIAPSLGTEMKETAEDADPAQEAVSRNVAKAVRRTSAITIWESKCLVQAIAAMRMLERRRIESTLYLGTAKDESGKLIAHAWLRSGRIYVTGEDVMKQYAVVGKFAKLIPNRTKQKEHFA
jgi:hypothetical protein